MPTPQSLRRFGLLVGAGMLFLMAFAFGFRIYFRDRFGDPEVLRRRGKEAWTKPAETQSATPAERGGSLFDGLMPNVLADSAPGSANAPAAVPLPASFDEEETVLVPGLLASHWDAAGRRTFAIEAIPALALAADEAVHPRVTPERQFSRWQGVVKILRGGPHVFSARLAGRVSVRIGETEVFQATADAADKLAVGQPIELKSGFFRLLVEFERTAPAAQLQLWWEAKHFSREPLTAAALGRPEGLLPTEWQEHGAIARGRDLFERMQCVACHGDDSKRKLERRPAPSLEGIGARVLPRWFETWLTEPARVRPQHRMPTLFGASDAERSAARAVAAYLMTRGGPSRHAIDTMKDDERKRRRDAGSRLFGTIGCSVCHEAGASGPALLTIGPIETKYTTANLRAFLENPRRHHPHGRMPNMAPQGEEARDLAQHLIDDTRPAPAAAATPADGLVTSGRREFAARRCDACHELKDAGREKSPPAKTGLAAMTGAMTGCLAPTPAAGLPRFSLVEADRAAIAAYLRDASASAELVEQSAPSHQTAVNLAWLNCAVCHQRHQTGGLPSDFGAQLAKKFGGVKEDELLAPPPLHHLGDKLRVDWIRKVLLDAGRSRPWLALRMPQFGPENVGELPARLAALDGAAPSDAMHTLPFQTRDVEDGRFLVSRRAFGCLKCHALAGQMRETGGVRGPDLAETQGRIHYEWFHRFMQNPQRLIPGTKMPANFTNGKSPIYDIHAGDAAKQIDALWSYFSLGANVPLPTENLAPEQTILTPTDAPVVTRAFLPDVGPWSIAIGFPDQVSAALDARQGRLAHAWSGDFLDVGPSWNNRGGQKAKPLGNRFWTGAPGFGWVFGPAAAGPPNFTELWRDVRLHAPPPDGVLPPPREQLRLHFLGYDVQRASEPSFEWGWMSEGGERWIGRLIPSSRRCAAGVGLAQDWDWTGAAKQPSMAWAWAGTSTERPTRLDAEGQRRPIPDGESALNLEPLVLRPPTGGALVITAVASGGQWRLVADAGQWHVVLAAPTQPGAPLKARLTSWTPFRDQPGLLKEIAGRPR